MIVTKEEIALLLGPATKECDAMLNYMLGEFTDCGTLLEFIRKYSEHHMKDTTCSYDVLAHLGGLKLLLNRLKELNQ